MRRAVQLLVPEGFDDPGQPTGGNRYDLRIKNELAQLGWQVTTGESVNDVADNTVVLVDGILISAQPEAFVRAARRTRLVVLMHMPLTALPGSNHNAQEVLSAAAAVITTSRWTREQLLTAHRLDPDRVHVAHPGTDPAELATVQEDGRRLLCVATIAAHKGHDTLLTALDRIADLRWECTIVGPLDRDPEFVDSLRRQLEGSRVADRVTLTGTLVGDALAKQYGTADLVVLASRVESYGMVLGEALARGVPVVASKIGGIPEAVGVTADGAVPGHFVPAGDADALADGVAQWLQDARFRHRLRSAARDRRASLPTWRATGERVAEVLTRVAG